ncbi:uncharacterized protein LOC141909849 [Tubulanus polymorphus]|uniref:uncharacterized protein LOC141909849 n=1 Tax=Tubulanus polymorphus TaxID=672921 RepID=UPI003DA5F1D9
MMVITATRWDNGLYGLTLLVVSLFVFLSLDVIMVNSALLQNDANNIVVRSSSSTNYPEDKNLDKIVRRLETAQKTKNDKNEATSRERLKFIKTRFSHIVAKNTLPNVFLHQSGGRITTIGDKPVVFLHHPRAAGHAIYSCLEDMARADGTLPMSRVFDAVGRADWDAATGQAHAAFRSRLRLHRGPYAFGICDDDKVRATCSYFAMLRDPFDRAVSSYRYCQGALGDEMCAAVNANRVTLREWIVQQGSVLLRQLVFSSDICRQGASLNVSSEHVINKDRLPCWYRQKLSLDRLSVVDLRKTVDHVVENLERWFAVVGIYERFDESVRMFEHAFNLPFTDCNWQRPRPVTQSMGNRANRNDDSSSRPEDDRDYLLNDFDVKSSLEADFAIYKKAQQIFKRQRQLLMNR